MLAEENNELKNKTKKSTQVTNFKLKSTYVLFAKKQTTNWSAQPIKLTVFTVIRIPMNNYFQQIDNILTCQPF